MKELNNEKAKKIFLNSIEFIKNAFKYLITYLVFTVIVISILNIFIYSFKDPNILDLEKLKLMLATFFKLVIILFSLINLFVVIPLTYLNSDNIKEAKTKINKCFEKFFAGLLLFIFSERIIFEIFKIFKLK